MTEYLVVFGFFIIGFTFMALMLIFAKFKKTKSACCGDILDNSEKKENCYTCPNRGEHFENGEDGQLLPIQSS